MIRYLFPSIWLGVFLLVFYICTATFLAPSSLVLLRNNPLKTIFEHIIIFALPLGSIGWAFNLTLISFAVSIETDIQQRVFRLNLFFLRGNWIPFSDIKSISYIRPGNSFMLHSPRLGLLYAFTPPFLFIRKYAYIMEYMPGFHDFMTGLKKHRPDLLYT